MVSVHSAELIVSLITFFIAYVCAVTIAKSFRAWVALKMGDDTGEALGFLTLNPLMHIDPIGVVFLLFFGFGWGRHVPINPHNIIQPHRRLKLLTAYFSDAFAYLIMALIGIVLLILAVGPQMIFITQYMLMSVQHMSHLYIAQAYPELSSLTITLSYIVIAFVYLNVLLSVLNFILNCFAIGMYVIVERSNEYNQTNYYLFILVPMLLIFLFSEPLRILAIRFIVLTGYSICHVLGMV